MARFFWRERAANTARTRREHLVCNVQAVGSYYYATAYAVSATAATIGVRRADGTVGTTSFTCNWIAMENI